MKLASVPLVVAGALVLVATRLPAQTTPRLREYFTYIPSIIIDPNYRAPLSTYPLTITEDLNGDGYQDLLRLGAAYPAGGVNRPQAGAVYLGDGTLHFTIPSAELFPVDSLQTVHPSAPVFGDFNRDGRNDLFLANAGWDAAPYPGEQNRLFLSRPDGGWRDATSSLPQLNDYTHTAAVGDISGRGLIDIFAGNGYLSAQGDRPYTLLNMGSGQFTMTRSNIPVGSGQLLDQANQHSFNGSTLADLNGDGLPELVITIPGGSRIGRATILWNRAGQFSETDITQLPASRLFADRYELGVQRIDINQDGLPDLVLVGTQQSTYAGWFVQILINHGNRQFVDETAARIPQGDAGRTAGPGAFQVHELDFNHDGVPDFYVEFVGPGLSQDLPLIWLNDGTGRFSTLKVEDFVTAGDAFRIGASPHLVETADGYSFITTNSGSFGLRVIGLLAIKPYRTTPTILPQ